VKLGPIDVVNTNVLAHAGRIWALVESGPMPAELDGGLTTRGGSLFNSPVARGYSAHPHRDPDTGALHAVCYDGLSRRVHHLVVDAAGRLVRTEEIPVRHGPMIHDCAITRSQVVVLDLPVTFSLRAFFGGAAFPYRWNPKHAGRVGLLPMNGSASQIRWFDVDPCYVFHTSNAFETNDGSVVLDVVAHPEMFNTARNGPELAKVSFERWTLAAGGNQVRREVRCDRNQEFPRFDERLTGRPYRYAYTAATVHEAPADGRQPLFRHDLHSGSTQVHDFGAGCVTGEAVFVPRHAQAAEDDGWLLSYVYDAAEGRSALVILNAGDFQGAPQAVVHLPVTVPAGFHGNWIADAELAASAPAE
jgi:carotenoid cleavage dioxygenase